MASLHQPDAPPVILASASQSRAALLRAAGVPLAAVRPAAVDEAAIKEAMQAEGAGAGDAALALAELKATRIAAGAPGAVVLGADQILTCAGRWFDKPASLAEARAQLAQLAGQMHELHTAAIALRDGGRLWHHVARTRLWMRPCTPAFLDRYLAAVGEAALHSVGAYHIEGLGAQLFARVEGDRFAIQGLPLLELLEMLRVQGVLAR
jgi:septum formation protein